MVIAALLCPGRSFTNESANSPNTAGKQFSSWLRDEARPSLRGVSSLSRAH